MLGCFPCVHWLAGYLAEWTTGDSKSKIAEQAIDAYQRGMGEATLLPAGHPVRLGLALNFSVFQHEVLKDRKLQSQVASTGRPHAQKHLNLAGHAYRHLNGHGRLERSIQDDR